MHWNRKQWTGVVVLTAYLPLVVPFPLVFGAIVHLAAADCSESKCDCCATSDDGCSEDAAKHCPHAPADSSPSPGKCPCPLCPDEGQQSETCICFACAKFIDSAARILDPDEQSRYFAQPLLASVRSATAVDCWRPPRA